VTDLLSNRSCVSYLLIHAVSFDMIASVRTRPDVTGRFRLRVVRDDIFVFYTVAETTEAIVNGSRSAVQLVVDYEYRGEQVIGQLQSVSETRLAQ